MIPWGSRAALTADAGGTTDWEPGGIGPGIGEGCSTGADVAAGIEGPCVDSSGWPMKSGRETSWG